MPISLNEKDYTISMPPGDTGDIYLEIEWKNVDLSNAAIVFGVCDSSGDDILLKQGDIVDGKTHIRFCNRDTRDLEPGNYKWQMRIVTDPATDENGKVIADDCSDDVVSVFNGNKKPKFILENRGARV